MHISWAKFKWLSSHILLPIEPAGNMAETRGMGGRLAALASKVDSKIYYLKDVLVEYMDMKNVVAEIAEERERFQLEQRGSWPSHE